MIDFGGKSCGIIHAKKFKTTDPFAELLTSGNKLPNSGTAIRKSFFDLTGGFREDKEFVAVEDFDLWLRVSHHTTRFKAISRLLGKYFLGPDQISKPSDKSVKIISEVFRAHQPKLDPHWQRESMGYLNYTIGMIFMRAGNIAEALFHFKASLSRHNMVWLAKSSIRITEIYLSHNISRLLLHFSNWISSD